MPENVQIIQDGYAAFSRGDIAAVLAVYDENIEWTTPEMAEIPNTGTVHGHAGVGAFFQAVGETWEFQSFEPREFIASGDTVVVRGHYDCKSRRTGRSASSDWVMVFKLRDGKVTQFQEYTNTAVLRDALTAASAA
jgi:ketosteroid isomerase-like protein